MSTSPELLPIVSDLRERFGAGLKLLEGGRANEIYFHGRMDLVPGFSAQLYKKWGARLVSLFADDVRQEIAEAMPRVGRAVHQRLRVRERR